MRSRSAVRLVAAVVGAVVTAGLVSVSTPTPAYAVDSPSNLAATVSTNPVLSWDRVAGATGYDVELSRTADFTSTSRLGNVVSTNNVRYVPVVQLPTDIVWWRVRAKAGSTLGEYATGFFTPAAVAAPVMVRPAPDVHFRAPEAPYFTWEPVAGATGYVVQTGRDPQFVDPAGIAENKQKTTSAYLTAYPSPGEYFWRVRAELSSGYYSAWSDSRPYVVDGLPAVERVSPDDSFEEKIRDVVLDWAAVPGAATYELQVSTDIAFANNSTTLKADAKGLVSTQWSPPATLANDEYYWRVRAVDASGNPSPWPATPWHVRRGWADQAEPVHPSGTIAGAVPFFYEWTPVERASKYSVHLYDDTGDEVCSYSTVHTTLAGECVPDTAGDYVWKVRATDGPVSPAVVTDLLGQPGVAFHYEPPAPITPAQAGTLSTDQVTGHATSLTGTASIAGAGRNACTQQLPATCLDLRQTPVLTWDPVPGATTYKVTVSADRELTTAVPGVAVTTVKQPMYTFPTTRTLPDSQAGSAYFWVVQPCGQTCAPIAYPKVSFAKRSLGPVLTSPADNARVQDDVTLDWETQLLTPRPVQDTSSVTSQPTVEALNYTVQTSTDPNFASFIDNVSNVDETTFTSPGNTYPEGFVYWRVCATDGGNNALGCSERRRFEKRSDKPRLRVPEAGAALGADYTFSWDALPFAKGYDLEVYSGPTRVANPTNIKYTSWAPSDPFPVSTGDYTWRVRRVDAKNRQGEWTDFRSFRMEGFPVAQATPAADAVVAPNEAIFTWLPDPRATSYRFERRKPNDPSNTLAEQPVTRATGWAPTATLAAGTAEWRVVALDAAGKDLGASPWRTFVVVDPPATATPVSITGSGKVGEELRLSAPVFVPPTESTTYQWYRGTSKIDGATGETYTVGSSDVGKAITVQATGVLTAYKAATSTSNAIAAVTGDALVAVYPPVIVGEPRMGVTLGVTPGAWPEAPRLTYQWFRDGTPISRATQATYKLTADDVDHDVHVVETAAQSGRTSGTSASEPVTVDPAGTMVATAAPTLSGTPRVGERLTATTGTWSNPGSYTYRWQRNGATIPGATSSRYTLVAADAGRRVQVVVIAAASGWTPGTSPSAAMTIAKQPSTTTLTLSRTRATTRQRVTATVRISAVGLTSPGGTVTFYDGTRKLVAKALGTATTVRVTLPLLRAGAHTIKAVYSGGAQVGGSSKAVRLTITR